MSIPASVERRRNDLRSALAMATEAVDYYAGDSDALPYLIDTIAAEGDNVEGILSAFASLVVSTLQELGIEERNEQREILQRLALDIELA